MKSLKRKMADTMAWYAELRFEEWGIQGLPVFPEKRYLPDPETDELTKPAFVVGVPRVQPSQDMPDEGCGEADVMFSLTRDAREDTLEEFDDILGRFHADLCDPETPDFINNHPDNPSKNLVIHQFVEPSEDTIYTGDDDTDVFGMVGICQHYYPGTGLTQALAAEGKDNSESGS
jgi:hypothetical protein